MKRLPTWAKALGAALLSAALYGTAQMPFLDQVSAGRKGLG